eukprot:853588-Rhodomonas_salina.3
MALSTANVPHLRTCDETMTRAAQLSTQLTNRGLSPSAVGGFGCNGRSSCPCMRGPDALSPASLCHYRTSHSSIAQLRTGHRIAA